MCQLCSKKERKNIIKICLSHSNIQTIKGMILLSIGVVVWWCNCVAALTFVGNFHLVSPFMFITKPLFVRYAYTMYSDILLVKFILRGISLINPQKFKWSFRKIKHGCRTGTGMLHAAKKLSKCHKAIKQNLMEFDPLTFKTSIRENSQSLHRHRVLGDNESTCCWTLFSDSLFVMLFLLSLAKIT